MTRPNLHFLLIGSDLRSHGWDFEGKFKRLKDVESLYYLVLNFLHLHQAAKTCYMTKCCKIEQGDVEADN